MSYKNIIKKILYLTAIFPYVDFGISNTLGTKPLFHITLILKYALDNKIILIKYIAFSILFIIIEAALNLYLGGEIESVGYKQILSMTMLYLCVDLGKKINPASRKIIVSAMALHIMFALLYMTNIEHAAAINKVLTNQEIYTNLSGITYFGYEPGLSAIGIFTIGLLYLKLRNFNNSKTENTVLAILFLLVISTSSGTGLLLAIALLILYKKKWAVIILLILGGLVAEFNLEKGTILELPMQRIKSLIIFRDHQDESPALRIRNMEEFFQEYVKLKENRTAFGVHGVGFVSYGTMAPITTMAFIIYGVIKAEKYYKIIFLFYTILLPLGSPYFAILFMRNPEKEN